MSCALKRPTSDWRYEHGARAGEAEAVRMSILLIMCPARQMNEPQQRIVGSKPLARLYVASRPRTSPCP
jgi:hypothetical protein